jgi:hypothetical protein
MEMVLPPLPPVSPVRIPEPQGLPGDGVGVRRSTSYLEKKLVAAVAVAQGLKQENAELRHAPICIEATRQNEVAAPAWSH